MDSTQSLPLSGQYDAALPPGAAASTSTFDNRATSFSGSTSSRKEVIAAVRSGSVGHGSTRHSAQSNPPSSYGFSTPLPSQRSLSGNLTRSSSSRAATIRSMPHVYPALLSRVAEAFKQMIVLSELVKDGITYKDAFDGRAAVAIIAEVIKTPDRNLALLLGRALDAQKFFHDVTYDHRLRDNPAEVYQFKERLTAPYINDNQAITDSPLSDHPHLQRASSNARMPQYPDSGSIQTTDSSASFFASTQATPMSSATNLTHPSSSPQLAKMNSTSSAPLAIADGIDAEDDDLPVGVFTLLTDCYSPTCSRDSLCYSINCPRRLEQMKRLNMKPQPGLTRKISSESLHDVKVG